MLRRLVAPLRSLAPAVAVSVVALVATACGDDGATATEQQRSDQMRALAADAGLSDEVADFFALAGQGASATFTVTYPGTEPGTTLTITQRGLERRIDVVANDAWVETTIQRDDGSFVCRPDPTDDIACEQRSISGDELGVFSDAALGRALEALAAAVDAYEFRIETRTIADTDATCLVTAPGTDVGAEPGAICLSGEGAVLSVFDRGQLLEAVSYDTSVGDDAFDLPG